MHLDHKNIAIKTIIYNAVVVEFYQNKVINCSTWSIEKFLQHGYLIKAAIPMSIIKQYLFVICFAS